MQLRCHAPYHGFGGEILDGTCINGRELATPAHEMLNWLQVSASAG